MTKRDDAAYEIESLSKGLLVLEALEGIEYEAVSVTTVMERTGFSRDFCDRALKTLRMRGYAKQLPLIRKWAIGPRLVKMSGRYSDLCMKALAKDSKW